MQFANNGDMQSFNFDTVQNVAWVKINVKSHWTKANNGFAEIQVLGVPSGPGICTVLPSNLYCWPDLGFASAGLWLCLNGGMIVLKSILSPMLKD